MRRTALAIASLVVIVVLFQTGQINLHTGLFSEPAIITLSLIAEYGLLVLAILLWRSNINAKEKNEVLLKEKDELRKQVEEEKYSFDRLFNNASEGIIIFSLNGIIERVNSHYCQLASRPRDEIIGKNYFHQINDDSMIQFEKNIEKLIQKDTNIYQHEIELDKKNRDKIWLKSTITLLRDKNDKPTVFVAYIQNITSQKNAEEKLKHMAYFDSLTGLANRNRLEQFINHAVASSRRQKTGFAVIFLDLDGFKNINDSIGHDAGDLILQIVAERLRKTIRNTDMVARLGGDEFVLVITDVRKAESAAIIAQKILENVLEVIAVQGQEIYMTASLGISLYPSDGQNIETLMKQADLALYRSKELGRNNYQFYKVEMTAKAQEKLALQGALGHALAKKEFELNYQPKMELQSRRITGLEALLRWKSNEYIGTTPDEIVALAEETGLILPVSNWVLHTACQQLKEWHDQGFKSLGIAVNCSARQFKSTSFVDDVFSCLKKAKILPNCLELEITESMVMNDPENTLRILYQLRDIGVQIVIDDFGTGYWSLNNLRRLSVTKIKIDRTFVKQCTVDETSAMIVRAIIAMANKLNIKTIAEGVETKEQYEFLLREGCSEIQGYYLTQPLSGYLITEFLKHPVPDAEATTNLIA